jgi:hypothetical protein
VTCALNEQNRAKERESRSDGRRWESPRGVCSARGVCTRKCCTALVVSARTYLHSMRTDMARGVRRATWHVACVRPSHVS